MRRSRKERALRLVRRNLYRLDLLAGKTQGDLTIDELQRHIAEKLPPPTGQCRHRCLFALGGDLVQIVAIGDDLGGDAVLVRRQLQQNLQ